MIEPIWPWAEANQGLLSVLALVLALAASVAVFWLEQSAQRRAAKAEKAAYVDAVLNLIRFAMVEIRQAQSRGREGVDFLASLQQLAEAMHPINQSADNLALAPPRDGLLAVWFSEARGHMLNAGDFIRTRSAITLQTSWTRELGELHDALERSIERIEGRRDG